MGGVSLKPFEKEKKPDFCRIGLGWQTPFAAAPVTLSPEDCSHWS